MLTNSFGSLYCASGQSLFAITSTPIQFTGFNTLGPVSSNSYDGDKGVIANAAQFGLQLLTPGAYRVAFTLSGLASGAGNITVQARINGVTLPDCAALGTPGSTTYESFMAVGYVILTRAQISSIVGDNIHALLDTVISSSTSINFTTAFGCLEAQRME